MKFKINEAAVTTANRLASELYVDANNIRLKASSNVLSKTASGHTLIAADLLKVDRLTSELIDATKKLRDDILEGSK